MFAAYALNVSAANDMRVAGTTLNMSGHTTLTKQHDELRRPYKCVKAVLHANFQTKLTCWLTRNAPEMSRFQALFKRIALTMTPRFVFAEPIEFIAFYSTLPEVPVLYRCFGNHYAFVF